MGTLLRLPVTRFLRGADRYSSFLDRLIEADAAQRLRAWWERWRGYGWPVDDKQEPFERHGRRCLGVEQIAMPVNHVESHVACFDYLEASLMLCAQLCSSLRSR